MSDGSRDIDIAIALAIIALLCLAAFVGIIVWFVRQSRRPLTPYDLYCSAVDEALDARERQRRTLAAIDAAGDGADRVWPERAKQLGGAAR